MKNEASIRAEMVSLFSKTPGLTPELVDKAVNDAIKAMKKSIKKNEKPELPTVRDPYGVALVKGLKVAFNYSGSVAIGLIEDIKRVKRYGKWEDYSKNPYICITIARVEKNGYFSKDFSKVSNPHNLVVV